MENLYAAVYRYQGVEGGVDWRGLKLICNILKLNQISHAVPLLIASPHIFKPCKAVNPRLSTLK
jgi:hypothetical protein